MIKLMKYLKKSAGYVILIIALLFLQAYCDLSLPDYTSKIVNVGIQQKGIEDGVPDTIRKESMEHLLLFLDEEEKAGLIERKPDEKDQRVVRIYVTEKGKSLSKQIEKVVKESEAKVVEGFSEVEICLMKRFLKQMIANMEQEESKKE